MWRGRKGNKETSPQISCIRETVRGASASAQTEPVWTFPTALFNLKRTEQEMVTVKLWHEKFYSWIQRKDRLARRWTQWRMERTRVTSITYWARQVPISQHQRRQLGASCAPDTRTQWTGCCLCICACVQPFGSLGDLSCEQPSVADGVLQRLLQALQLVTSTLEENRRERRTRLISRRVMLSFEIEWFHITLQPAFRIPRCEKLTQSQTATSWLDLTGNKGVNPGHSKEQRQKTKVDGDWNMHNMPWYGSFSVIQALVQWGPSSQNNSERCYLHPRHTIKLVHPGRIRSNTFIVAATMKIWAYKRPYMTTFHINLGSLSFWRLGLGSDELYGAILCLSL